MSMRGMRHPALVLSGLFSCPYRRCWGAAQASQRDSVREAGREAKGCHISIGARFVVKGRKSGSLVVREEE